MRYKVYEHPRTGWTWHGKQDGQIILYSDGHKSEKAARKHMERHRPKPLKGTLQKKVDRINMLGKILKVAALLCLAAAILGLAGKVL